MFAKLDLKPVPKGGPPRGHRPHRLLGGYVGTVRETGAPLEAAFAHVLRVRDGQVTDLVQVTDSARWHEALAIPEERGSS